MGLPKETLANPIFLPPGLFTEIERLDDCWVGVVLVVFVFVVVVGGVGVVWGELVVFCF